MKQVEQVSNGRAVDRNIRISLLLNWIGEIVPATRSQRTQSPIPLDELQDRDVVGVSVVDVATLGEVRYNNQWNPWSVAEEVERLNVSGIIVAAAFVQGDHQGCACKQLGIRLQAVNDLLCHAFKQIKLRRSRMPVKQAIGLHERNCGQCVGCDRVEEVDRIL